MPEFDKMTDRDKAAFYANQMEEKAAEFAAFIQSGMPPSEESHALALALIADEALCDYYSYRTKMKTRRAA